MSFANKKPGYDTFSNISITNYMEFQYYKKLLYVILIYFIYV